MNPLENSVAKSTTDQPFSTASNSISKTSAPCIRSPAERQRINQLHDRTGVYTKSAAPVISANQPHSIMSEAHHPEVKPTKLHKLSPQAPPSSFSHSIPLTTCASNISSHSNFSPKTSGVYHPPAMAIQIQPIPNVPKVKNARAHISFQAVFHNEVDAIRLCVAHCRSQNQQDSQNSFRETHDSEVSDSALVSLIDRITIDCIEETKRNAFLVHCRKAFIGDAFEHFHFDLPKYEVICSVIDEFLSKYARNISNLEVSFLPKHILHEINKILRCTAQSFRADVFHGECGALHGGKATGYSQEVIESSDHIPINVPRTLYNTLLPYQRQALVFAIGKCDGRVYIADDMGLGKTLEAISLSLHYSSHWPLLIITPSSLKHQWKAELEKWIPFLRLRPPNYNSEGNACIDPFMEDSKIAIIDKASDVTSHFDRESGKCKKNLLVYIISYSLASTLAKELKHASFDIAICDEAHYLKGQDAKRSKAIKEIVSGTARLILLSGTPALSRPLEMYQQLDLLLKGKQRISFKEYGERYCTADGDGINASNNTKPTQKLQYARRYLSPKIQYHISKKDMYSGHSNLDELRWFLQKTCLIRRTKNEVLSQMLPEKKRNHVILHISPEKRKEFMKITSDCTASKSSTTNEQTLKTWLTQSSSDSSQNAQLPEDVKIDQRKTETIQLFYETAMMKIDAVTSYLDEYLSHCFVRDTDKIVIFAHHNEMLNRIESTINSVRFGKDSKAPASQSLRSDDFDPKVLISTEAAKFEYIRIDGATPILARANFIQRFQTQNTCKIALCSLLAVGVGVNFCAAKTCIFAELYWTPAVLIQAEDRIHRLGQKGGGDESDDTPIRDRSVEIQYLIAQGTFDDSLWPLVQKKFAIMSKMLENTRGKMLYTLKERKREGNVDTKSNGQK